LITEIRLPSKTFNIKVNEYCGQGQVKENKTKQKTIFIAIITRSKKRMKGKTI
jgi:hypothetical protein